ncbi:MAG TPA: diacylglycerol kinase [Steroidobacteraceae bacterium]|nr:diacylglycerol kinase [Steroidobacteraceae bacterium]
MSVAKNQSFPTRLLFALTGLRHGLSAERSLQVQASVFVCVLVALVALRPGPLWWALVLVASAAVFAAELLNTSLEHLIDHLHPEIDPQIRIVKDCAAAAVLITVFGAIAVAVCLAVELLRHR